MDLTPDASHSEDEGALVARAVDGDAGAFGALYTRYLAAIYRYIFMRVGDVAQAEDMTEEVFVKAWEALPKYRPGQYPFTSWLYRIAHNLVVDHHRKRTPLVLPTSDLERSQDPSWLPEDAIERRQDLSELAWAVQQLSEEEQQVIVLRFVEGLSHREVAHIIGKSEGASRVIQHRALAALHELLSKQESQDG